MKAKALTLLELLVVLLLMSLALSLVGPRIGQILPQSPKGLAEEVEGLLEQARQRAYLRHAYVLFVIDPEKRAFYLADKGLSMLKGYPEVPIPEEVEVKSKGLLKIEGKRAVLFFPGGFSSGGEIELVLPEEGPIVFRIARFQEYVVRLKS